MSSGTWPEDPAKALRGVFGGDRACLRNAEGAVTGEWWAQDYSTFADTVIRAGPAADTRELEVCVCSRRRAA